MNEVNTELQGRRILVTGADGFIGSRMVKSLLDNNAEVLALVENKSTMARIMPYQGHQGLHLIKGSLSDARDISMNLTQLGGVDYLVHLGFCPPTGEKFNDKFVEEINLNILPTIRLIEMIGSSLQGICFSSSVSVYGYPKSLPIKETDLPNPLSSYGFSKLAIENYLRAYGTEKGIPVTILRYSTVFGPGEFGHRAIPNFLSSIAAGNCPSITGDGSEIKDYIFIDDVVKATTLAISYRPNAILNVGSGRGYSTLEIAKKLIQLSGAELEPNTNPIERRNVDIICDISAAREHLSFEPQTCLEEGIKQEIDWYWNDALTPAQKQNVNLHLETDHHNYKRRLLQRNIERTGHD